MLRSAEYTSPTSSSFVVGSTLQASDISFSSDRQFAMINIKQSKTDPFKTGCTIRITSTNSLLCPVTARRNHLHTRNKSTGPLYIFIDGKYLTRQFVANLLSLALPHVPNINTHSFRIGGASAAASAGIPDSVIQILGRWSSDAYKRYLRLADCTIKDVSMRVSSVFSNFRNFGTQMQARRILCSIFVVSSAGHFILICLLLGEFGGTYLQLQLFASVC